MNQSQQYLERFQQAEMVQQQRMVAEEYRAVYKILPETKQVKADEVMQVLWPEIHNEVAELEKLTQQAQQRLHYKTAWLCFTYEGDGSEKFGWLNAHSSYILCKSKAQ